MSAKDISRFLFQPQKRYSGVRMQQGRVILDSDWNESERIDDEEARRTLLDLVCAKGTPNRGFLVGEPAPATERVPTGDGQDEGSFVSVPTYDFALGEGSFYLGGLRFESGSGERFLEQPDWLQIDADPANLPPRPTLEELTDDSGNPTERFDLVYLRGWEQCVTAVEDRELRETALGGPDTSVRIRRMRRFEVLPATASSCAGAAAQLEELATAPRPGDPSGQPHTLDPESCELRSKARLTVNFADGDAEDPCAPRVTQGYLGAENQTLRVEITEPDRFIWGYDNASPLYRVQVLEADGEAVKIRFLTLPRDQAAQPLQGQAVEILPWGARLPNHEKVAELRGHVATVATSFDPDDPDGPSITITRPVPGEWLAWLESHPEHWSPRDADGEQRYLYLRLWTGGSGDADEPDFAFTPGTPVELAGTGLTVSFSAHGIPGDHWILAARPNTPDELVPWELMQEAPPAGTRFFYAPLALVRWTVGEVDDEPAVIAAVQDCRGRFRPLCELGGCCTVSVGDGVSSRGNFQSIQDAIDFLPPTGGQICLLPGIHRASARIEGRRNLRLTGCGKRTVVIPAAGERGGPIFRILDSECITIERMTLVHLDGTAILARGSEEGRLRQIEVAHARILAFAQAVRVERGLEIEIHHNRVRMLDRDGAGVALFVQAEQGRIERNDIGVRPSEAPPPGGGGEPEDEPDPEDPCDDPELVYANPVILLAYLVRVFEVLVLFVPAAPYRATGGIQIAAGSEGVRVIDNRIHGGAGNGVTLGGGGEAPSGGGGEREGEIELPRRVALLGTATVGGAPRSGVALRFVGDTGVTRSVVSEGGGFFTVDLDAGVTRVASPTPGLAVDSVQFFDSQEFPRIQVGLVEVEPEIDESLFFLYEIEVVRNDITAMGLSGIGVPIPPEPEEGEEETPSSITEAVLRLLGNPVIGLEIHRNRIAGCLRNPFVGALREASRDRGFGGVSLGICERTRISGNRIERNGLRHLDPVCGIYARFAEQIEIRDNRILANGPITGSTESDPETGVRGGIYLAAGAFGVEELLAALPESGQRLEVSAGQPAARIQRNVVDQPVGQALRLLAFGPVAIQDNRFASELPGPSGLELLAGAVLVLTVGLESQSLLGNALVTDNQTRLGPNGLCLTAQLLAAGDDVGYADNQSVALAQGPPVNDRVFFFVNTLILGETVRAADSRFIEVIEEDPEAPSPLASLLTRGAIFNNTSNNQGDHCIFVENQDAGRPPLSTGNQVIDDTLCPQRATGVNNGFRGAAVFGYRRS